MNGKFDWERLGETCNKSLHGLSAQQASNAVARLGPLARWFLRREVFSRAADDPFIGDRLRTHWRKWHDRPHVSGTYGNSWVVFVTQCPAPIPLVRDAFVLPLQWVPDTKHDARLPAELQDLAEMTFKSIRDMLKHTAGHWGLHLANDLASVDLRKLHLAPASGWAPLAAALYIAAEGGTPDPTVWATGSWSFSDGLLPVDDVSLKSQLAAEFGAKTFFVPDGQQSDVASGSPGLSAGRLYSGTLLTSRALADLLLRLDATPTAPTSATDDEGIKRCRDYYLRRPLREPDTKSFYVERLLPFIIQRRRREVQQQYPECRPSHLITIVSGSPELVELTARALEVDRCLLLHTADDNQTRLAEEAKARLEDANHRQKHIFATLGDFAKDSVAIMQTMERHIREFVAGLASNQVVFDLTPGTKLMTYALSRLAPPASWLVYLEHGWHEGRPDPDTEEFLAWQVGEN